MSKRQVIFSHGLESGPWGSKITALAAVAKSHGADVDSIDYQGMREPQPRVDKLLAALRQQAENDVVLVGSSMGGHVATAAAQQLPVAGLFVLAPAFFMPGYEALTPDSPGCPMEIVHGWHDDVVPVGNSIRFAQRNATTLHILDSDHRLGDAIDTIGVLFSAFLRTLD